MTDGKILWQPNENRIAQANITRFLREIAKRYNLKDLNYKSLHNWSVSEPEQFWTEIWNFCGVIGTNRGELVVENRAQMPGAVWFPDAQLNFAENLLRHRNDEPAIIFWGENRVKRCLSHRQLYDSVSTLQQALKQKGVKRGDRIAGFLPNIPEAIIAMLATASIGAVWSSCSPDFGAQGVLDRFSQINPKVLFISDGYLYNGRIFDVSEKNEKIAELLPTLESVILVTYLNTDSRFPKISNLERWKDVVEAFSAKNIDFPPFSFNEPLYIMFSSGTTGKPKCIIHGAGGTLIQHLKEHQLHTDIRPGDKLFYYTTCGWMMWNWLTSGLASGATIMLYDGLPSYLDNRILFDFAENENITHFGTSAKWIDSLAKSLIRPKTTYKLEDLRVLLSTGSPLSPESFDFVYESIKSDIQLASICGGTDIISCFVLGVPVLPVRRGEIQGPGLGMKVEAYDPSGQPLINEQGELVCSETFPSMPIGFWDDENGEKYHAAYFDIYPNIWRHGDWIKITENDGIIVYGRSDTTLNPGGVRIGTAEIYRQVERLDEVLEGLVIGQNWENDIRIVLFVKLKNGIHLDQSLKAKIKSTIRSGASPRHVPEKVIAVADLPRTVNGKITELAVTEIVHNRLVKNREALANPEALNLYKNLDELNS